MACIRKLYLVCIRYVYAERDFFCCHFSPFTFEDKTMQINPLSYRNDGMLKPVSDRLCHFVPINVMQSQKCIKTNLVRGTQITDCNSNLQSTVPNTKKTLYCFLWEHQNDRVGIFCHVPFAPDRKINALISWFAYVCALSCESQKLCVENDSDSMGFRDTFWFVDICSPEENCSNQVYVPISFLWCIHFSKRISILFYGVSKHCWVYRKNRVACIGNFIFVPINATVSQKCIKVNYVRGT